MGELLDGQTGLGSTCELKVNRVLPAGRLGNSQRQGDLESRARPSSRHQPNVASVGGDDRLDDGQAKTSPTVRCRFAPLESSKDSFGVIGGHPLTVVIDPQPGSVAITVGAYPDRGPNPHQKTALLAR